MSAQTEPESTAGLPTPVTVMDDRRRGITNLRRHTARGMVVNSAFQLGLVGVSALRGFLVAAFLSRSDYGVWGIVGLTLWTTLGFKSVFGANDRYIQQSEADQELAFQRAFTVEIVFASLLIPIAAGIVVLFASLTGHSQVLAPGLVLIMLVPSIALQFPFATFLRRMDYRRQRILQAIEPLSSAVVMIGLAAAGAGYWCFIAGSLTGSWLAAIVAMRASPYAFRLRVHGRTLREYFGFSFPLLIAGISQLGVFYVVYLLGAGPLGLAGLGAFTLVGNLVQFTDQADGIITETLYPAVCAVSGQAALLREIFVKSNRLSLMWAVPFGIGLTLFGADLFRFVLGRHWLPALGLLQIMGIVTAVNHVGYNWSAFVRARGETWPMAVTALISGCAVIACAIPLMYSSGIEGLAIAFAVGQGVDFATRSVIVARLLSGATMFIQLLRGFAPTVIAATVVLFLRVWLGGESRPAAAIALFAVYVAVTVAATVALERPLLREATGYLLGRRREAPVAVA